MPRYSEERKQAVLQKMAPPRHMTVAELAAQEGISDATLYNWRKSARAQGAILPSNSATPDRWRSEDKFRAVLETAPMSEAEFSAYCRQHGLFPEQVQQWKAACAAGNDQAEAQARHRHKASRQAKQRIKKLESELRRKDKALAETVAFLRR